MMDVYVKNKTIHSNSQRIWGSFRLSDKTTTKFEMKKGESWFQWGNSTENLCITVDLVERLCDEW